MDRMIPFRCFFCGEFLLHGYIAFADPNHPPGKFVYMFFHPHDEKDCYEKWLKERGQK